ncbi:ATP-binding cassette domain-containing protein, partial [Klebsiella aerogenes]
FWKGLTGLKTLDDRVLALLELVDLRDMAQLKAADLPYGRKRALEIATTMAMEPQLMLLDEPTQGMGHE